MVTAIPAERNSRAFGRGNPGSQKPVRNGRSWRHRRRDSCMPTGGETRSWAVGN